MSRWLTLVFALTLGACATVPSSSPSPERSSAELERAWLQHRQAVAQITDWSLSGRIVVNTEDDGWNGELHWSQGSGEYRIQFSAPFGQGAFQLDGSAKGVEMRFSDGQAFQAADAESLLLQHLGWNLPLSGFRYWVSGLPQSQPQSQLQSPSASVPIYNDDGQLASLQQGKWQITYPEYVAIGGVMMPRKVYLKNHELSVRLVIDSWTLNQLNLNQLNLDQLNKSPENGT